MHDGIDSQRHLQQYISSYTRVGQQTKSACSALIERILLLQPVSELLFLLFTFYYYTAVLLIRPIEWHIWIDFSDYAIPVECQSESSRMRIFHDVQM